MSSELYESIVRDCSLMKGRVIPETKEGCQSEAVSLWRKIIFYRRHSSDSMRSALDEFVSDENADVSLIAMISRTPDTIWERLLWRHNINLETFEAFLRRLSDIQRKEIIGNYNDLFVTGIQPRVLTEEERKEELFGVNRLLNSYVDHERYERKGSWSEMHFLDMGFNEYPGGPNDDRKITALGGVKEFVRKKGDQEFFVICRNPKIGAFARIRHTLFHNKGWDMSDTMGRNICLIFLPVMIMSLVLWVISPAANLLFLWMAMTDIGNLGWVQLILMAPYVAWLVCVICAYFFGNFLPEACKKVMDKLNLDVDHVKSAIIYGCLGLFFLALIALVCKWTYLRLAFSFGGAEAIFMIATAGFYFVGLVFDDGWSGFSHRHPVSKFFLGAMMTQIVMFVQMNHSTQLLSAVSFNGSVAIFQASFIVCIIVGSFHWLDAKFEEAERRNKNEKELSEFSYRAANLMMGIFLVSSLGLLGLTIRMLLVLNGVAPLVCVVIAWIIGAIALYQVVLSFMEHSPEVKQYRWWMRHRASDGYCDDQRRLNFPIGGVSCWRLIRKNSFLMKLCLNDRYDYIMRAHILCYQICAKNNHIESFLCEYIPIMTKENLEKLEEYHETHKDGVDNDNLIIAMMVIKGTSFEDAKRIVKDVNSKRYRSKRAWENFGENFAKVVGWIFFPVIFVGGGICRFVMWILMVRWFIARLSSAKQMCPVLMPNDRLKFAEDQRALLD